jgi:hypothetical protein
MPKTGGFKSEVQHPIQWQVLTQQPMVFSQVPRCGGLCGSQKLPARLMKSPSQYPGMTRSSISR